MSSGPRDFYYRRVPAQWNKALEDQQQKGREEGGEEATRVAKGMVAVDATIRVLVRDDGGSADRLEAFLNIEAGRMTALDEPAHAPFMTLAHDHAAFEVLERESGDSVLGFLGGLAGLQEALKLTAQRMQNLADLAGTLRFELTGDAGFALLLHFGAEPMTDEPRCTLQIAREAYEQLRSGELNPQDAFMSGQIVATGDMQMAMQLALAAMTPD
jgi:putative sterol carrier protein